MTDEARPWFPPSKTSATTRGLLTLRSRLVAVPFEHARRHWDVLEDADDSPRV